MAKSLNISIFYENLGTINGYYNKPFRMKQIHINQNLNEKEAEFTCAHELGHAILHPNASTPFLRSKTFISVDKLEIEANNFAVNLLIPDDTIVEIVENRDYTIGQMARLLGYSQELIKLRMKAFYADNNKDYLP